jgi:hypothetical protein
MKRASANNVASASIQVNGKPLESAGAASGFARSAKVTQHLPEGADVVPDRDLDEGIRIDAEPEEALTALIKPRSKRPE